MGSYGNDIWKNRGNDKYFNFAINIICLITSKYDKYEVAKSCA